MSGPLAGVRILFVEDDEDSRFMLAMLLTRAGAVVEQVASAEEGLARLETWQPDLLLCDLSLPGLGGHAMLETMRSDPRFREILAVALSGHAADTDRARSLEAGFEKHLAKPTRIDDVVAALAQLRSPEPSLDSATLGSLRALVEQINASSPCRFTSILRIAENDSLVSVWTYDRQAPHIDPFPLDLPVEASYCVLVRSAMATVAIENAATDRRAQHHPKRDQLACYVGTPLLDERGGLFGTVCSYDEHPQTLSVEMCMALESGARRIAPILRAWFGAAQPPLA